MPDGEASDESDNMDKLCVANPDESGEPGRGTVNSTMTVATIEEQANSELDHIERMLEKAKEAPAEEKVEHLEHIKTELGEIQYLIEG